MSPTSTEENPERERLHYRCPRQNSKRIENLISDFVSGLMRIAVAQKRREEDRKRCEAEQHRRAEERAQLQKDIEEEEKIL
jgi:hypothetical protein